MLMLYLLYVRCMLAGCISRGRGEREWRLLRVATSCKPCRPTTEGRSVSVCTKSKQTIKLIEVMSLFHWYKTQWRIISLSSSHKPNSTTLLHYPPNEWTLVGVNKLYILTWFKLSFKPAYITLTYIKCSCYWCDKQPSRRTTFLTGEMLLRT